MKRQTELVLVIDTSGSMIACQQEAEEGINRLLHDQRAGDDPVLVTLVEFGSDVRTKFVREPLEGVGQYVMSIEGLTALHDAVGSTIDVVGERLAALAPDERPDLVIVVVVTDGEENFSRRYSRSQVLEAVERQQRDYSWQFVYLGATPETFADAASIGISPLRTSQYDVHSSNSAYSGVSQMVSRLRTSSDGLRGGVALQSVTFTDDERTEMAGTT